ncbi:uncharacterized protein LOC110938611 [Helianthus annuus]|uniref:uncharacterized protein LOC110938611 n=1 Tax=Helianthus annuus TaxID=4232 RepID=UPI000B8EF158|nr:uncharacterized protein LOC110938611 [Helianthus annuus]
MSESENITGYLPVNTADSTGSETVSVHHQQQLQPQQFPLGLSLDNGREIIGGAFAGQQLQQQQRETGGSMNMSGLFPQFENLLCLYLKFWFEVNGIMFVLWLK